MYGTFGVDRSLYVEAEELARRVPPAAERQRQVATWLAQRSAALEAQRQVLGGKQLELIEAEAALRAAETELDFMAEARNEIAAAQVRGAACLVRVGVGVHAGIGIGVRVRVRAMVGE